MVSEPTSLVRVPPERLVAGEMCAWDAFAAAGGASGVRRSELQVMIIGRRLAIRERLAPAQQERFNAGVRNRGYLPRLAGVGPPTAT